MYYYKYIKYKTLYFKLKGGSSEIDLHDYNTLYDELLRVCQLDESDRETALQNIKELYSRLIINIEQGRYTQDLKYKMEFLTNCLIIIFGDCFDKTSITIDEKEIKFYIDNAFDTEKFYYLEDVFKSDLNTFYKEYKQLTEEKRSEFFYKSNLVNISILLRCFKQNCFARITIPEYDKDKIQFYKEIPDERRRETRDKLRKSRYYTFLYTDFENNPDIISNFNSKRFDLIFSLMSAFKEFVYNDVFEFYINYLHFYFDNLQHILPLSSSSNISEQHNKLIDYFKSTMNHNKQMVYLSCNLSNISAFQRFEATNMLISNIGSRFNNDSFYSTIDLLDHDFFSPHEQAAYKKYDDEELIDLQKFYTELSTYEKFTPNELNQILLKIQNDNYEDRSSNIPQTLQGLGKKRSITLYYEQLLYLFNIIDAVQDLKLIKFYRTHVNKEILTGEILKNFLNDGENLKNYFNSIKFNEYEEEYKRDYIDYLVDIYTNRDEKKFLLVNLTPNYLKLLHFYFDLNYESYATVIKLDVLKKYVLFFRDKLNIHNDILIHNLGLNNE
jgi:hypothetical protein